MPGQRCSLLNLRWFRGGPHVFRLQLQDLFFHCLVSGVGPFPLTPPGGCAGSPFFDSKTGPGVPLRAFCRPSGLSYRVPAVFFSGVWSVFFWAGGGEGSFFPKNAERQVVSAFFFPLLARDLAQPFFSVCLRLGCLFLPPQKRVPFFFVRLPCKRLVFPSGPLGSTSFLPPTERGPGLAKNLNFNFFPFSPFAKDNECLLIGLPPFLPRVRRGQGRKGDVFRFFLWTPFFA